jgi:ribosomal protein L1
VIRSVAEQKPDDGIKGRYIRKISIASTMGPGISLDAGEINETVESVN